MSRLPSRLRFATARLATGPRLHYAEQGDAAGEALVLLHGWPDSWFSFSRVLPLLAPRYHALVPDQRGFGDSERPVGGYEIDDLASDVAALLDATGVQRATVVGHSFGTFVARRVAVTYPERVVRLVLIDTAVSPFNQVTREVQAGLRELSDPVPIEFARQFQAGTVYLPVPDEFFERIVAESVKMPARVWRALLDGLLRFDDVQQLGKITAPTLLLYGERDELFAREDQDRLARMIPHARLKIYPETGHCPNWERPELIAADLEAFMQETSPAR